MIDNIIFCFQKNRYINIYSFIFRRTAAVSNTSSITAISLDMRLQKHPIIWSVNGLPHDSFHLVSIPKPIGGVMVMSTNSIIVCNQNIKYKLALNQFVPQNESSSYATHISDIPIALDAARFAFLSKNRFIASLKGGELYIFHITAHAGTVHNIAISRGSASVISTSICTTDEKYFFLGSRIGDSVLIEYKEGSTIEENSQTPTKVQKLNDGNAKSVGPSSEFDLDDDIEEFYSSSNKKTQKKDFVFTKIDSLINTGPIADFCFGICTDRKREEFSKTEKELPSDPEEIVACTGYGKNGAITVLQRGVRPSVTISFQLPDCQNIWTLFEYPIDDKDSQTSTGKRTRGDFDSNDEELLLDHTLLLVSTENSSMVLTAKDELVEITGDSKLAFFVDKPTINAGNFHHNMFIQIGENSVRLLSSAYSMEDEVIFEESIDDSIIYDTYILLSFGPLEPFIFLFIDSSKYIIIN